MESGGWELAEYLEAEGYDAIREKHQSANAEDLASNGQQ